MHVFEIGVFLWYIYIDIHQMWSISLRSKFEIIEKMLISVINLLSHGTQQQNIIELSFKKLVTKFFFWINTIPIISPYLKYVNHSACFYKLSI